MVAGDAGMIAGEGAACLQVSMLATSLEGGAGIAARRLSDALVGAGIRVDLMFLRGFEIADASVSSLRIERTAREMLGGRGRVILNRRLTRPPSVLFTPLGTNAISRNRLRNSGIVHVHNWYNLVTPGLLSRLAHSRVPVVVTLHDERSYTGGCHHAGDCAGYTADCAPCPQTGPIGNLLGLPTRARGETRGLAQESNVHFVAPSAWILQRFIASGGGSHEKVSLVRNCVPDAFFQVPLLDLNQTRLRDQAGPVKLLWHPGKDDETVMAALKEAAQSFSAEQLQIIHTGDVASNNPLLRRIDFATTESARTSMLEQVDALIHSSRFDNFPNAVAEASAAGRAVIASEVGGSTEGVDQAQSGLTFAAGDVAGLVACIRFAVESRGQIASMGARGRAWSLREVASGHVAQQHIEIYQRASRGR